MLKASSIHKKYNQIHILKGVDLDVKEGEIVSIVGASGAGKSTLLQILGTLDKPDQGEVLIKGVNINELNEKGLAGFRNKNIGFIFQFHNLLPEFTALENVCIPAFLAGTSKIAAEDQAKKILKVLGLDHRLYHKPSEMSGGEQQRTAVARALINKPSIIFADEPSGNLDSSHAEELHQLFFTLRKEFGHTFVIVTHNQVFAESADRMLEMKDGLIVHSNDKNTAVITSN